MITIVSYGTGHGDLEQNAHVIFPLAQLFKDPHVSPAMREMTGKDPEVMQNVLMQLGALAHLSAALKLTTSLVPVHHDVVVAFSCVGGRHRSVVFADSLADLVSTHHASSVRTIHRDLHKPVIQR